MVARSHFQILIRTESGNDVLKMRDAIDKMNDGWSWVHETLVVCLGNNWHLNVFRIKIK